jgi:hypothetical protein
LDYKAVGERRQAWMPDHDRSAVKPDPATLPGGSKQEMLRRFLSTHAFVSNFSRLNVGLIWAQWPETQVAFL